ncbi:hypothetical protein DMUE_3999, partial [Dictyocoela muelleri]
MPKNFLEKRPMENIKKIKNQKGGRKLIYKNFIYNYSYTSKNFISWRCHRRGCSGRIHTDHNLEKKLSENTHWHEEESTKIAKADVVRKLKQKALSTNDSFEQALLS